MMLQCSEHIEMKMRVRYQSRKAEEMDVSVVVNLTILGSFMVAIFGPFSLFGRK
jgi:hypothetical protein